MRGVILAAGRGSRMGRLTADRPKCLTRLAGKPLFGWQIEALRAAGVEDLGVVRGYLGQLVSGEGLTAFENPRWAQTNMVATLTCARAWLEAAPCIVSYADILFHPQAVRVLKEAQADLAITYDRGWLRLWSERFADPLSDAETFRVSAVGRLTEIGRRPTSLVDVEGQYMGLLKFTPEGWRQVQRLLKRLDSGTRDRLDMTSLLQRLLAAGVSVVGVAVDGHWCEVDSESDLRLYEAKLRDGKGWSHDWRW